MREDSAIREQYEKEVKEQYKMVARTDDIENYWNNVTKCLTDPAKNTIPVKDHTSHNVWMTPGILQMMEERSNMQKNTAEYKDADRQIKRECTKAKEQYINSECEKINVITFTTKIHKHFTNR